MIERMRQEVSYAKSDEAKAKDQVLIRDLQINEVERLAGVMTRAEKRSYAAKKSSN